MAQSKHRIGLEHRAGLVPYILSKPNITSKKYTTTDTKFLGHDCMKIMRGEKAVRIGTNDLLALPEEKAPGATAAGEA
ncbi:MAG: hypothetical protein VB817_01150 [Pirellulaceae bacterium]